MIKELKEFHVQKVATRLKAKPKICKAVSLRRGSGSQEDDEGEDVCTRIWTGQLTQIPKVSLKIAKAITASYPSFTSLEEGIATRGGNSAISELRITDGGGGDGRRLGVSVATRIVDVLFPPCAKETSIAPSREYVGDVVDPFSGPGSINNNSVISTDDGNKVKDNLDDVSGAATATALEEHNNYVYDDDFEQSIPDYDDGGIDWTHGSGIQRVYSEEVREEKSGAGEVIDIT
eukprot:GHVU01004132.1.p1 GENE.GHVU01004132.1~~GHVU01004132.1.p1  ORF type:complete len:245 (+),score=38.86 GHVU01004132.1:37-735(+)